MQGYLLTTQPFIRIFFQEPGVILFGFLLMLMSATLVLAFLVKQATFIVDILIGFLVLMHFTLDSILTFDLIGNVTRVYRDSSSGMMSELFSTHRWLLIQIPILFTFMAIILALVCRNHMKEAHAKEYVFIMQVCVLMSFLAVLFIGYESLI